MTTIWDLKIGELLGCVSHGHANIGDRVSVHHSWTTDGHHDEYVAAALGTRVGNSYNVCRSNVGAGVVVKSRGGRRGGRLTVKLDELASHR